VVDMLERWHQYIIGWVFGRVFGMLSSDGRPMSRSGRRMREATGCFHWSFDPLDCP
jgi:hypothetical protein